MIQDSNLATFKGPFKGSNPGSLKVKKNCLISVSDVFFPQLSNDVGNFSEIFYFHLQNVQNVLYLKKYIFNIYFYPLDRKLSIFYVGEDIFPRVPEMFSARNRIRKRF